MNKYKRRAKELALRYGPVIVITAIATVKLDRYVLDRDGKVHIPKHVADVCLAGGVARLTKGGAVLRLALPED